MSRTLPPKSVKREMRACHQFLAKLGSVMPRAAETETCAAAGVPRNQLSRWRNGRKVSLDYAWLLAQKLGVSLEWLADDSRPERPGEDKMAEVLRVVERLGIETAMARLINKPETGEPSVVKKPPRKPRSTSPKSGQRQPRR